MNDYIATYYNPEKLAKAWTVIERDFQRIQDLFEAVKAARPEWTGFDQLSIGMSGDWPIALRHGATMVRIGTDIFGPREY